MLLNQIKTAKSVIRGGILFQNDFYQNKYNKSKLTINIKMNYNI